MDLSTTYMGLTLKNPLVPSASPLSRDISTIKKLEDAGASAIVVYSIFEEQIALEAREIEHYLTQGSESFSEALSYFPQKSEYKIDADGYPDHIRKIKSAVGIPVIGSLNCISVGGWMEYSRKLQEAGADALELNLYFIPTNPNLDAASIEKLYFDALQEVKKTVTIPIAVKLSPYFTNLSQMITALDKKGANGIALFNRFYQPDLNLENLSVEPGVVLSNSSDLRLPLRWIAIMYGKVNASLAGTGGVHTASDALKMIAAGADVAHLCAAILKNGPEHLGKMLKEMEEWLVRKEYKSLGQLKGSLSQKSVAEPAAFERANYMKAINDYR